MRKPFCLPTFVAWSDFQASLPTHTMTRRRGGRRRSKGAELRRGVGSACGQAIYFFSFYRKDAPPPLLCYFLAPFSPSLILRRFSPPLRVEGAALLRVHTGQKTTVHCSTTSVHRRLFYPGWSVFPPPPFSYVTQPRLLLLLRRPRLIYARRRREKSAARVLKMIETRKRMGWGEGGKSRRMHEWKKDLRGCGPKRGRKKLTQGYDENN